MLVHDHYDSSVHHRWDWAFYVAGGFSLGFASAPAFGVLPLNYPLDYTLATFAGFVVLVRGLRRGWGRGGRVFLTLGAVALMANSVLLHEWFRIHQTIRRMRLPDEISRQQERLHIIVRTLEYARQLRGEYPQTLEELEDWIPSVYFADLWDPTMLPGCMQTYPGYARSPDGLGYELFGIGPDCLERTDDDVFVGLQQEERVHVGLRNPAVDR